MKKDSKKLIKDLREGKYDDALREISDAAERRVWQALREENPRFWRVDQNFKG